MAGRVALNTSFLIDLQRDPELELHVLLPIDEETAIQYGKVTRRLRDAGRLIGTNDLWIAAPSLRHGLPLVTGNTVDFARVDGLDVISYR